MGKLLFLMAVTLGLLRLGEALDDALDALPGSATDDLPEASLLEELLRPRSSASASAKDDDGTLSLAEGL